MKYNIKDYKPLTIPKSIRFRKIERKDHLDLFEFVINNKVVTVSIHNDAPVSVILSKEDCINVREEFKALDEPYPYIVRKFAYNGFSGRQLNGFTNYKATFINWTGDPGMVRMLCSDGIIRCIPTFALKGHGYSLPEDTTKNKDKIMFGTKSRS